MDKILRNWNRFFFRGFSIRQRLPLLICTLLLGVIITFGIISYLAVKRSAEKTGEQRLISLGDQFGNMLAQSVQTMISSNRQTATLPEVRSCLSDTPYQKAIESIRAVRKES